MVWVTLTVPKTMKSSLSRRSKLSAGSSVLRSFNNSSEMAKRIITEQICDRNANDCSQPVPRWRREFQERPGMKSNRAVEYRANVVGHLVTTDGTLHNGIFGFQGTDLGIPQLFRPALIGINRPRLTQRKRCSELQLTGTQPPRRRLVPDFFIYL